MKHKILRKPLFFTLLVFISCSTKIKTDNSKFDLVSVSSLKEYNLLSFSNGKDTILTVANKKADALCIIDAINEKDGLLGFKKIAEFDNAGQKILFIYQTKSTNNYRNITVGSGSPGQKAQYVNSYKSYPYLVENCER